MHVAEMREREDFDEVLVETLSRGWQEQYGTPTEVRTGCEGPGQRWWYQPLLSAFVVRGANALVRRFLRNSFRYTPVTYRALPQWILGTAIGSKVGLRLAGQPGFTVREPLDGAESMAVIPGNQRVRIFDFDRRRTRVFLKEGFDTRTMNTEIALRASGRDGPFPQIKAHDDGGQWFEEELLDAFALPRCPPWLPRHNLRREALARLEAWASSSVVMTDSAGYIAERVQRIETGLAAIRSRFNSPDLAEALSDQLVWLSRVAAGRKEVAVARSHGDFQPGNILVDRRTREVTVIDWEHYERRSRFYDRLVLSLESRSAGGLAERITQFVRGQTNVSALRALPDERDWRLSTVALFLLEDLEWFIRESQTGPFTRPSTGLLLYRDELEVLRQDLGFATL